MFRSHRWWTAATALAGLAYLGWRALATLDGAPGWLAYPAFAVEALGVLGVIVLLLALERRPLHTTDQAHATAADVIVRVEAEPLGRIAASLAGLRHARNVSSTTILTFTDRDDVRQMAEEHGVEVYYVDPEEDATGLRMAQRVGRSPFLVILDAGDVPMPDMADILVRHAYDGHIAGVRGAVDSWSTDSAEHDSKGRHQLRFEREVLYPAAGRAAVLQGSGVLLRRWAIQHVGVPSGPRRTVELRLSMRLRTAGLEVVAPADPVLVSAHSANTAAAVGLERRRDTAAALRMLRSTDGPLLTRGLSLRDRIALLATMVRPLSGVRRGAFVTIVLLALLAGELPLHASLAGLAGFWVPWMALQAMALRVASAGRLDWGDRARWSFSTMGPALSALFDGAGDPVIGAGRMLPRRGALREFTSNRAITYTLVAMAVVVPAVAISDRFTGWLPPMVTTERAGLLAVTMWAIVVMLDVMRCLNGASCAGRLRRPSSPAPWPAPAPRSSTSRPTGRTITDEPLQVDQEVTVSFDVPGMDDRISISADGVVRSVRSVARGRQRHRVHVDGPGVERRALRVLRSGALAGAVRRAAYATRRACRVPVNPPVVVPSRSLGVRLAAGSACSASPSPPPPYATTEAAPTPAGGIDHCRRVPGPRRRRCPATSRPPRRSPLSMVGSPATIIATCLADNGGDATNGTGDGETYAAPVTAVDAGNGTYTLTNLPGSPCRIEVSALPDGFEPGPLGPDNAGLSAVPMPAPRCWSASTCPGSSARTTRRSS
ncbi:MAG: glycosyltransferase family 2 protein [Ilumatobacteraceae bacterium]